MLRMRRVLVLCLALLMMASTRSATQVADPMDQEDVTIEAFLLQVERAISAMDRERWAEMLSTTADRGRALAFYDTMVPPGITRVVVKERDRVDLLGTLPGYGFRLLAEVFIETGPRGRIATWNIDIRRPHGTDEDEQPWRIVASELLSALDGLHRLSLSSNRQYTARNLTLRSVDFELRLPSGEVFVARTPEGTTALVLLGNGSMVFEPRPKEERGQVRIFSGAETMDTPFTAALVRVSPFAFASMVDDTMLVPASAVDPRAVRRAQQVFDEDIGSSFGLDLNDLSRERWSLLPPPGDFVAEVRTRRYGKLTFARSMTEPEDVSLFQRQRKRNIALYASEQKLAMRGTYYDENDLVDYDVLDYDVDSTFTPARDWLEGRTSLTMRVRSLALATITLKLNESLTVNSVHSDELGRLLFLRVVNQSSIVINLPRPVAQGTTLKLHVSYQGRLPPQGISDDSLAVDADQQGADRSSGGFVQPDEIMLPPEPDWLFSSQSQWYPQAQVTDYATARLRITVPAGFSVLASGIPQPGSPVVSDVQPNGQGGMATFSFAAPQPVRYLSMVVSRLFPVDTATVLLPIVPPDDSGAAGGNGMVASDSTVPAMPPVGSRNTVALTIEANRRQENRGRDALPVIVEILQLYASLIGDVPYDALHVAMVEDRLPGGHAPGYLAVLNNPLPTTPFTWKGDPAHFGNIPEFFLAHEIAHQWFGQAVGWKNYHEQWLSEGFAQYFAALYARERRGDATFRDVLRQMRRWSLSSSAEGPVFLGYRLGHIKGESRVFRALVYNKAAMVLHMLSRQVGDEAFFRGVQRYYRENRFRKAGTADLRRAMEQESGQDLERFFARWVHDSGIPRVRYATTIGAGEVAVRFEQGNEEYDVPVTVTVQLADGSVRDEVVRIGAAVTEVRIPVPGPVRAVLINDDHAALAHFDRSR